LGQHLRDNKFEMRPGACGRCSRARRFYSPRAVGAQIKSPIQLGGRHDPDASASTCRRAAR
jgi:hypothetical protein